jgi:hypothetical protein
MTLLGILVWVAGCAQPQGPGPAAAQGPAIVERPIAASNAHVIPPPATAPSVKPFVMHLPGVSGTSGIDYTLREGLKAGGFDGPFEIYDWTCHDPGIPALQNRPRNEQQAAIVADILTKQYRAHPNQPIYLTCHSGGSGPATWALERLPKDVKVTCFVMLAPALSPGYDLSKALSRVTDKAFCFYSPSDDLVLGTGTKMFGTIDGQRCDAAGRIGFEKPATATDPAQYDKLVSKPYDKDWVKFGHVGGHMGCMGVAFAEAVIAPAMLGHAPSPAALNRATRLTPDVLWPK